LGLGFKLFFVWILFSFFSPWEERKSLLARKTSLSSSAVVAETKLWEEQEPQRIDWVPDEILLPAPRREQREQQFHEHCLMMDALRHSIHSRAFFANFQKTQHEKKQNMRVNQNLLLRTHFEGRHHWSPVLNPQVKSSIRIHRTA
jgi:hypothetical protein